MADRHIFFDLDRTLWDFDRNSELTLNHLFDCHNLRHSIKDFETFHKTYLNRNKALWMLYSKGKMTKDVLRYERFRSTFKKFNISDETLVKNFGDEYVKDSPQQTHLRPHALEVLKDLKDAGFHLHIITNGFAEIQDIKLKNSGLFGFFDCVVCSEELGINKPDRRIYEFALDKAGALRTHSLMIGDDYRADVQGAIHAGLQAIWYEPKQSRKSNFENKISCLSEVPQLAMRLLRYN